MESHQVSICVPICKRSVAELKEAHTKATAVADSVELRLDCLAPSELEQSLISLQDLIITSDQPTIITLRAQEEGGQRELDYALRKDFWNRQNFPTALFDVELDLVEEFASLGSPPVWDWNRIICSHHDFNGVPSDLDRIYRRLAATPARILKIAVRATDITDCLAIFRLLDHARREGREMIAIAMGAAGVATRILGPSRGAFLTYGAIDDEHATAPGQVTEKELRELYRVSSISGQTRIMGLIGAPVAHSLSPPMHNAAFAATARDAVYIPFAVRDVAEFIKRMVRPGTREIDWNLRGLSVTAPHKAAVLEHLDRLDPAAIEIGAVNTIVIEDEQLLGYNTDASALIQPLLERFGTLRDRRCAILGAGGAASAALYSLSREGAEMTVFARNEERARVLAAKFGATGANLDSGRFAEFDLVLNATPLGTLGPNKDETPATAPQLHGARLAYDLVYNPVETRFLREARAAGCETIGGLAMLILQAAEQFKLWTGIEAPIEIMREAAVRARGFLDESANRQFEI